MIGISQVIIIRCIFIDGSADCGCGVSLVEAIIVTHITIGSIVNGSGCERACIQNIQGACRTSSDEPRYKYTAQKIGPWSIIGAPPPRGFASFLNASCSC